MDIFQQWLLLRIHEHFSSGRDPLQNAVSFDAIAAILKPLFEQEDALFDEDEVKRHLDILVELGYLLKTQDQYFLTLRAIAHSEAALYLAQSAQNEFAQFVRAHWWKAVAVVLLLTIAATVVTVNVMAR